METFQRDISIAVDLVGHPINPFRTAVPFWGQATWNLTDLSPKRGCGSEIYRPSFGENRLRNSFRGWFYLILVCSMQHVSGMQYDPCDIYGDKVIVAVS